jgi:hypothetical protein
MVEQQNCQNEVLGSCVADPCCSGMLCGAGANGSPACMVQDPPLGQCFDGSARCSEFYQCCSFSCNTDTYTCDGVEGLAGGVDGGQAALTQGSNTDETGRTTQFVAIGFVCFALITVALGLYVVKSRTANAGNRAVAEYHKDPNAFFDRINRMRHTQATGSGFSTGTTASTVTMGSDASIEPLDRLDMLRGLGAAGSGASGTSSNFTLGSSSGSGSGRFALLAGNGAGSGTSGGSGVSAKSAFSNVDRGMSAEAFKRFVQLRGTGGSSVSNTTDVIPEGSSVDMFDRFRMLQGTGIGSGTSNGTTFGTGVERELSTASFAKSRVLENAAGFGEPYTGEAATRYVANHREDHGDYGATVVFPLGAAIDSPDMDDVQYDTVGSLSVRLPASSVSHQLKELNATRDSRSGFRTPTRSHLTRPRMGTPLPLSPPPDSPGNSSLV